MKILDVLHLAWINIKSNKFKSIIYGLILSLFTLLIICFFSFSNSVSTFFTNYLNSDFHFKMIAVEPFKDNRKDVIKKIENLNIKEVSHIYRYNLDLGASVSIKENTNKFNGFLSIYGNYNGINYTLDSGRKISADDEIVCPSSFSPSSLASGDNNNLYDLKEYINSDFDLSYEQNFINKKNESSIYKKYSKKFKLVGTYDVSKDLTDYNSCYISTSAFESILKEKQSIFEVQEMEDEAEKSKQTLPILVLTDKYENVPKIIDIFKENGLYADYNYKMDLDFFYMIQKVLVILSIVICFISVVCIYLFIKSAITDNQKNITLYKFLGYNVNAIKKIFLCQYMILTAISFLSSIIIAIGLKEVVTFILSSYPAFSVLNIYLSFKEAIFYLLLIIIIIFSLINFIFGAKFVKMEALELMGKEI